MTMPEEIPTTGLIAQRTFEYSYVTGEVVQVRLRQFDHFPTWVVMDFFHRGQRIRVPFCMRVQCMASCFHTGPVHNLNWVDHDYTILWFPFNLFLEISAFNALFAEAESKITTLAEINIYENQVVNYSNPKLIPDDAINASCPQ